MAEQYVAFLRAINVGGRVVKMDRLRELFETIPLAGVEPFIASGNVAFQSRTTDARALEKKIEKRLRAELGYEVETFVRTASELAEIADYQPFAEMEPTHTLYVGFLAETPTAAAQRSVVDLRTAVDSFHVRGRELYWWCSGSETLVTGPKLARTLGMPTTLRNITTVRRLVAKYPAKTK